MKRIIYIATFISMILLTSCYNERDVVVKKYPNAEVYNLKLSSEFIVIDSTGIYYVACKNPFSPDITEERLIKKY